MISPVPARRLCWRRSRRRARGVNSALTLRSSRRVSIAGQRFGPRFEP